jgi:hypothetical protein
MENSKPAIAESFRTSAFAGFSFPVFHFLLSILLYSSKAEAC